MEGECLMDQDIGAEAIQLYVEGLKRQHTGWQEVLPRGTAPGQHFHDVIRSPEKPKEGIAFNATTTIYWLDPVSQRWMFVQGYGVNSASQNRRHEEKAEDWPTVNGVSGARGKSIKQLMQYPTEPYRSIVSLCDTTSAEAQSLAEALEGAERQRLVDAIGASVTMLQPHIDRECGQVASTRKGTMESSLKKWRHESLAEKTKLEQILKDSQEGWRTVGGESSEEATRKLSQLRPICEQYETYFNRTHSSSTSIFSSSTVNLVAAPTGGGRGNAPPPPPNPTGRGRGNAPPPPAKFNR